jgi:hypothetical protein
VQPLEFTMDIAEVDAFLQEPKTLQGTPPDWERGDYPGELSATWNIADSVGIVRAQLRFRCPSLGRHCPSISVVYRGNLITRLDLVPPDEFHPNPPGAAALGLPPKVYGSHWHPWSVNRRYTEQAGFGRLPYREPIQPQVRRLPQALIWLADRVNLTIAPDQRDFDAPPQGELFP